MQQAGAGQVQARKSAAGQSCGLPTPQCTTVSNPILVMILRAPSEIFCPGCLKLPGQWHGHTQQDHSAQE